MKSAKLIFDNIINETKQLGSLYSFLETTVKPPFDYNDILRWQLAQAVAGLDLYIHELVKIGIIQIYSGKRERTKRYRSFSLTLEVAEDINSPENKSIALDILEKEINKRHGFLSFQTPEKISEALSYVWEEKHKWQEIAGYLNMEKDEVMKTLKLCTQRRNQIVHEADYIDTTRQNIKVEDVEESIIFIEKIVDSIHNLVSGDVSIV
ncbi:hypothetical protein HCJ66_01520 [Listeria sp. FSL L7-1582]|uniref:HEPN domain-containing protein n=1 Tax=Listeria portnoyi TaxID=2713504 RepID=UPI00164DB8BD|nr:HEPN domain-containing protein [Listeria portnoyi]MBC6308222.1 hypothetical protein [Listeria portnoyi]